MNIKIKNYKRILAITVLIFALYFWYKRFDVITHPEYYGELILPIILSLIGIFMLTIKSKNQ